MGDGTDLDDDALEETPSTHAHPQAHQLFEGKARADAYNAWAERLRNKRVVSQDRIREAQQGSKTANESSAYWSADALFNESRSIEHEERETGALTSTKDLLAIFHLAEGASLRQVTASFRGLAKLHHPDRYGDADDETRERHAVEMQKINTAYKLLREKLA